VIDLARPHRSVRSTTSTGLLGSPSRRQRGVPRVPGPARDDRRLRAGCSSSGPGQARRRAGRAPAQPPPLAPALAPARPPQRLAHSGHDRELPAHPGRRRHARAREPVATRVDRRRRARAARVRRRRRRRRDRARLTARLLHGGFFDSVLDRAGDAAVLVGLAVAAGLDTAPKRPVRFSWTEYGGGRRAETTTPRVD
jgi:hypothetical protein